MLVDSKYSRWPGCRHFPARFLGMPVPAAYYQSVGDEEFAKNPIGTGPFSFAEQRIGDFMALSAVEDHWREGPPTVATVRLEKVPEESTRIAALKTGEADIITVSRENVPEIRNADLQVFLREGQAIVGFYFHQQWDDVPIADIKVREALNLAVNREAGLPTKLKCHAVTAGADSPVSRLCTARNAGVLMLCTKHRQMKRTG